MSGKDGKGDDPGPRIQAVADDIANAENVRPEDYPPPEKAGGNGNGGDDDKSNKSTKLRRYAHESGMELWLSEDGVPYATVPITRVDPETRQQSRHFENVCLTDARFKEILTDIYDEAENNAPGAVAVADAITLLSVDARRSGKIYRTYRRVGECTDRDGDPISDLWIDLGDREWRAIRITAEAWSIEPGNTIASDDKLPVKFLRTGAMQALPLPTLELPDDPDSGELGGPIWKLRDLINPNVDDDEFLLIVGFIVAAFHPRGPYPVLAIDGVQGSGKSTLSRIVRRLIDPNKALLRSASKDITDLTLQANNAWVVSLDNQSGLQQWLSDGICSVSTGQGMSTRELYTNDGEIVFNHRRPVIVNGINRLVERFDLADRCFMIELPQFEERKFLLEGQLDADFAEAAPAIFAAILDGLVSATRDHRTITPVKTRMIDVATWIEAAGPSLGFQRGEFAKAYLARKGEAVDAGIDRDPVASAIDQLIKDCGAGLSRAVLPEILRDMTENPEDVTTWPIEFADSSPDAPKRVLWRGTPTQLLKILMRIGGDEDNKTKSWPSANSLWNRITRCLPLLRKRDINVRRSKSGSRIYTITGPFGSSDI